MRLKLFSMVFLPMLIYAQFHKVPLGTQGNTLVYTVRNQTVQTMYKIGVFVESAPGWIQFENNTFMIYTLPSTRSCDASFRFNSGSGEAGQSGKVIVGLMNNTGEIISKKALTFCAVLKINESKLHSPFPNPANPSTTVRFSLKEPAEVRIMICHQQLHLHSFKIRLSGVSFF